MTDRPRGGDTEPEEVRASPAREAPSRLAAGTLVDGRYRVVRPLGRGGMGQVLLAEDVYLRRKVALKLISRERRSEHDRARLQDEAAALASIRHTHVASVYAFGFHEGAPFFAMEHIEGRDLHSLIDDAYRRYHVPLPFHRALAILGHVADGLGAVHAAGIVHRDVKPSNVVIEERSGRAVLVDFGLAKPTGSDDAPRDGAGTDPSLVVGTPHYMAPECAAGAPATPASDLYSLGCLAYELLTGTPPFEGATAVAVMLAHHGKEPPALSSRRPELAPLDHVLLRALAKDPRERFTAAAAMANALSELRPAAPQMPDSPAPGSSDPSSAFPLATDAIRILVVDDDVTFARMAARCAQIALAGTPLSVSRVGTAAAALDNAARRRPDLVILDFQLPDLDGVDLLSHLREMPGGDHARILVASGATGHDARWRFGILGVRDFVDKPVALPELVERITRVAADQGWLLKRPSDPEGHAV